MPKKSLRINKFADRSLIFFNDILIFENQTEWLKKFQISKALYYSNHRKHFQLAFPNKITSKCLISSEELKEIFWKLR